MKIPKTLEGYCNHCKIDDTFKYVSSSPLASDKILRHYYAHSCGETHPLEYFRTLNNIHNIVVSKKR